jgi:hypothetical protein
MVEAVIFIAAGWFGHKYKDPIISTVKGWFNK